MRLCYGDASLEMVQAITDLADDYAKQGLWPQVRRMPFACWYHGVGTAPAELPIIFAASILAAYACIDRGWRRPITSVSPARVAGGGGERSERQQKSNVRLRW